MRTALASIAFLAASAALVTVVACSSSNEEQPTTVAPIPTTQPTADAGPQRDAGPETGAECLGAEGCFKCEVENLEQALNACTESQCAPFDNAARLPLYNGGSLPPVP